MLKNLADRKQLGAYYTPSTVADILCDWAITSPNNVILEPSFGGCEFLDSSIRRLEEIGCAHPERQIFGCDIDPHAFDYLSERPHLASGSQFIQRDFLQAAPIDFGAVKFDVVMGNPPYVRHQKLGSEQKLWAQKIRQAVLPDLNLQTSLWGLFLIHSSRFLREGGRFAWLLPSSFVYADYAKHLQRFLRKHFAQVRVITLDQRLFESQGAMEGTVVLAAAGWTVESRRYPVAIHRSVVASIEKLGHALSETERTIRQPKNAYNDLVKRSVRLGDYCSMQIGIVTGNAAFFLLNKTQATMHGLLDRNLSYVIGKSAIVPGLTIAKSDLRKAYEAGLKVKIFSPQNPPTPDAVEYIRQVPKHSIESNLTFNKRPIWYQPLDKKKSEAFFAGMSHLGPRLVLNSSGATCTNSLYRVSFKSNISKRTKQVLALLVQSTFSQLSAEHEGRAYSAGMLKHEPSDAGLIRLLLPSRTVGLKQAFAQADRSLRAGDAVEARKIADRFLIANGALSAVDCGELAALLQQARDRRMVSRQKPKLLDDPKNSLVQSG